jgi:hypothetical protein
MSLHSIRSKINIASSDSSLTTSSCDAPFKILLDILGYWTSSIWDLFEVDTPTRPPRGRPCQTLAAMLEDLGVSTLRSIKTMP